MDLHAQIIKILILTTLSFVVTLLCTPLLEHLLYKYKLHKKIRLSATVPIFAKLHAHKQGTPTMGGLLIWVPTLCLALLFFYLSELFPGTAVESLNFLVRKETFLPLGALVAAALIGLVDDLWEIFNVGNNNQGLTIWKRLFLYTCIAIFGAWWFYYKLEWTHIHIPFYGDYDIGVWYIPIFILIIVATSFAVNETDGLDGLAGGVLLTSFAAYGTIAFIQGRYNLTAFCGVVAGALLAFLWFNINPARFFMGDTGSMSLGVALGVTAVLTNAVFLLPIIGFVLVVESMSVIIQVTSKQLFKRKIFLSTPIHHTLEAIGWPEQKIVMRFWIVSAVSAVVGLIIFLLDRISY